MDLTFTRLYEENSREEYNDQKKRTCFLRFAIYRSSHLNLTILARSRNYLFISSIELSSFLDILKGARKIVH